MTGRKSKNVAAKKNRLDAQKNKLYSRLGVRIFMAAKANGTDPKQNVDLQRALKDASAACLPKDNIERALKKATEKDTENFSSGIYEVYGHGGIGLIVQTLTDNSTRANKLIKSTAKRAEVKMASAGSVLFSFFHKGVFQPNEECDKDQVLELLLNQGLDDFDFLPSLLDAADFDLSSTSMPPPDMIVTTPSDLSSLQDCLHSNNIDGTTSLVYVPIDMVKVKDEQFHLNTLLVEKFEEIDDVDIVFHNMTHNQT